MPSVYYDRDYNRYEDEAARKAEEAERQLMLERARQLADDMGENELDMEKNLRDRLGELSPREYLYQYREDAFEVERKALKKEREKAERALEEEKAYLESMREQNETEESYQRWKDARKSHEAGERSFVADKPISPMEEFLKEMVELLIIKGILSLLGKISTPLKVIGSMLSDPGKLTDFTPEEFEIYKGQRAAEKEKARLEAEEETQRIQKAKEPWDRARENQDPSVHRKKAMQEDRERAASKKETVGRKQDTAP